MAECKRKNAAILSLNKRLKTVMADMNVNFADLTESLSNEQGQMKPEYSHDGLHPNVRGYTVISEALMPLLKSK
jgi:lysophospholipase L1-like esterase